MQALERPLPISATSLRLLKTPGHVCKIARQNLPQPARQLGFVLAAELGKVGVGLQECFLNEIGRVGLLPQGLFQPSVGQES